MTLSSLKRSLQKMFLMLCMRNVLWRLTYLDTWTYSVVLLGEGLESLGSRALVEKVCHW